MHADPRPEAAAAAPAPAAPSPAAPPADPQLAMLLAISEASPDAIYAKDAAGRLLYANPATLELIGRPAHEVIGRTDREFLADAEVARHVMETDRRIMARGVAEEIEERVPTPDGREVIWLSRKMPWLDAAGRVAGLLGISRDITERKRLADAARASREALERVLGSITDGLLVLDRDWRYSYFNEQGARMLGLRREDLIGGCVWELFPHAADSLFGSEYRAAVASGEPRHFEAWYPPPLAKWIECHCYPSDDGLAVFFRDVSERHAAQAALQEADRRKDEFIAVLAHELRNPLAPIATGLAVLQRDPPREAAAHALAMMQRQLDHMVRLIDDLMDASRIRTGKVRLQRARLDLREAVGSAAEAARSQFAAAGLSFEAHLPDAALPVDADPTRLAQTLANLLGNAMKYTPRGGRVALLLDRVAADGPEDGPPAWARVRVVDDGEGIAPELLPRLFEMFRQDPRHKHAPRSGLGIGLALARQLVELHGGRLEAASDGPGHGSCFTLRLPIATPAAPPGAGEPAAPGAGTAPPA